MYPTFDKYKKSYDVDQTMLSQLKEMADKEKIPFNQTEYDRALPLIKLQIKALVARDLWDIRITSYNVCYTKLLRSSMPLMGPLPGVRPWPRQESMY